MFLCRVCLTFEDNLYPIHDYLQVFYDMTGILSEKTALLCPVCIQKLTGYQEFRSQAVKSHEILKLKASGEILEIKEEPEVEEEEPVEEHLVHFAEELEVREDQKEEGELRRSICSKKAWTQDAKDNLIKNCPYCFQYYPQKLKMMEHIKRHITQNGGLECDHCDRKFKRKKNLKDHLHRVFVSKSRAKEVACPHCSKTLGGRKALEAHISKSHKGLSEPSFLCQDCGDDFSSKMRLLYHIRKSHESSVADSRPFACSFCDKRFKTKRVWEYHEMTHTGAAPIICQTCGAGFKTKEALQSHQPLHTGELRFECDVCQKRFRSRQLLTGHKVLHSDDYRHVCSDCGMKFRRATNLREHKLCHTETRPFMCSICKTQFKARASLRRHLRNHAVDMGIDENSFVFSQSVAEDGSARLLGSIENYYVIEIPKTT